MKKQNLLEQLMSIPELSIKATIQGVKMSIIDECTRKILREVDPEDKFIHECILANGTFMFTMEGHKLKALYKVMDKK